MSIGDELLRLLVAQDPRRSADAALGLIIEHLGADGAACFQVREERLALFSARAVDQVALDRVWGLWANARASVLAGKVTGAETTFAIVPLGERNAVAGLLYVSADHGLVLDHDVIPRLAPLLEAAIEASQNRVAPPVQAYIERTPAAQFERERLRLLLERHEWNIARVARAKGVARLTIYDQMRRWGIERRKVVKNQPKGRLVTDPSGPTRA